MNRKQRRTAYAQASSQKPISKFHPMVRLEKMIQKTKSRIAALEGTTNVELERDTIVSEHSEGPSKPDSGSGEG